MKAIPFKCRFNHITIREFSRFDSTPTEIVCDKCIDFNKRIDNGEKMFRYSTTDTGSVSRGPVLTRKIPDGEKAYRY